MPRNRLANMVRRQQDLDNFTKGRIYALHFDAVWSYSKIAEHIGVKRSAIGSYCYRVVQDNSNKLSKRKQCRRPPITNQLEDEMIINKSIVEPFKTLKI